MRIILLVAVLIVALAGIAWYGSRDIPREKEMDAEATDTSAVTSSPVVSPASEQMKFKGEILAGDQAELLDFTSEDYDTAVRSDKLVVLYFYATWCPLCRAEFPKAQAAFEELKTDRVVGFRVNYNDSDTDEREKELAREFGVAYQHTKVFVRNGQRIGKWPESWEKQRYLSEISTHLK